MRSRWSVTVTSASTRPCTVWLPATIVRRWMT
jgi:hypothetical protein